ncbi:MAG: DNA polymerase I [Paludibacteraceae bacterium]|nr:DNA polymerase I [Paludibacteraceae bacterium]
MKKLLLIDAYAMIYRAYYAFMQHPRITSDGRNTSAVFGFVITLQELLKQVNPTHIGVAFDPKGKTFRHEAYPEYKAQRQAAPEDIHLAVPIIKDILKAMNISVFEVNGFEADDVIGTLAVKAENMGFDVLMATPDKDYGQLVTDKIHIYRPRHNGGFENMGPKEVCEKYGIKSPAQVIDILALMGDSSDNIPGCAGVGEKTAVKLLQDFGDIDNLLQNTEKLKGALKTKVETQTEQIRFSRFLATIRKDVPLEIKEDELLKKEIDIQSLTLLYKQLEFKSLLKGLSSEPIIIKQPIQQANLFDEPQLFSESVDITKLDVEVKKGLPQDAKKFSFSLVSSKNPFQDLFSQIEQDVVDVYISVDGEIVYKCVLDEQVKRLYEDENVEKIGYNLKEDYKILAKHGIHLIGNLFDVTVAHYLLQPEQHHEVEHLAEVYLKKECGEAVENKVAASLLLRQPLEDQIVELNIERLKQVEMQLISVLAEMEMAGVRFDTKILREAAGDLNNELKQLEKDILELSGFEFNINSPRQVGEVLFDRLQIDSKAKKTKNGQYVTSEEVLEELQDRHPIVGKILEYRAIKKLLSTYIEALPELINHQTGKIHTTYNQTVTATGRLSSSNPNLQNLPIRSERGKAIRRAVVADSGCLIFSADYSQIELRLMAHFSGDDHLLQAFRDGHDIHAATAAKIFGCSIDDVSKDMRRKAKTANFGIIYGISAFGLAQQLGSSRQEAKDLIDGYFASFPKVVEFIEKQKTIARSVGYVETMFGRRRYLPDINSRNQTVRSFAERNAVNAPIQGTAADIIKIAMVRIHRRFQEENLKSQMIMQVHDELNFNVPEAEIDKVKKIVIEEMENAVSLSVPLRADCGSGKNWLEAH